MMATTHALVGLAVGALALVLAPEHAPLAVAAGFLGGGFPDLDLYAGHRKTLHFPVYYPLAALGAVAIAAVASHALATAAAVFLVAAALHALMDVFGGGLELRPWEGTSNRAVFDHRRGIWLAPRRWVHYDGAPEDLALAVAVGVPLLLVLDGPWAWIVTALLALSTGYTLVRRPMVRAAEVLIRRLPLRILRHVPERFIADFEQGRDPRPAE